MFVFFILTYESMELYIMHIIWSFLLDDKLQKNCLYNDTEKISLMILQNAHKCKENMYLDLFAG